MLVDVNPKILIWAREECFGKAPIEKVADEVGIEVSLLKKWESEGAGMPFETLEAIAKIYKRQTAVFFLQIGRAHV